jgi:hypothetical protein
MRRRRTGLRILAVSLVSAGAMVVLPMTPASANCSINLYAPWESYGTINGAANASCSGSYHLRLWRTRWFGEQVLDNEYFDAGSGTVVSWGPCSGTYHYTVTLERSPNGWDWYPAGEEESTITC